MGNTHSPETERAVLAAVLLEPPRLEDVAAILTPADFYEDRHRRLFAALLDLARDGRPVDLRTVEGQLRERGDLETVGGVAYLASLDLDLPDLGRVETYAETVRGHYIRRELERLGRTLADRAVKGDPDRGPLDLAAEIRRKLEALEETGGSAAAWASDLLPAILDDAKERRRQREETGRAVLGIRSGISSLDNLLSGFHGGRLYLLAGAPGVGKTSLALQFALHAAEKEGLPVVYVTFENAAEGLIRKAVAARAGIDPGDVYRGFAQVEKLERAAEELEPTLRRLSIRDGGPEWTVGQLRATARRAMETHRADRALLILDYLQLAAKVSRELRGLADVRAKVDTLAGELLAVAKRLGCPVLALSSQSRAAGDYGNGGGQVRLDSLKESGDLEYAADAALFLTADPERRPPPPAQALDLTLKKNRHGPTGRVRLIFEPRRGTLREEADR